MKKPKTETGKLLRNHRQEHAYSQGELAVVMGVKRQQISQWEIGERLPRHKKTLDLFRDYLGIPLEEINQALKVDLKHKRQAKEISGEAEEHAPYEYGVISLKEMFELERNLPKGSIVILASTDESSKERSYEELADIVARNVINEVKHIYWFPTASSFKANREKIADKLYDLKSEIYLSDKNFKYVELDLNEFEIIDKEVFNQLEKDLKNILVIFDQKNVKNKTINPNRLGYRYIEFTPDHKPINTEKVCLFVPLASQVVQDLANHCISKAGFDYS